MSASRWLAAVLVAVLWMRSIWLGHTAWASVRDLTTLLNSYARGGLFLVVVSQYGLGDFFLFLFLFLSFSSSFSLSFFFPCLSVPR